jgi:hypothetical protein
LPSSSAKACLVASETRVGNHWAYNKSFEPTARLRLAAAQLHGWIASLLCRTRVYNTFNFAGYYVGKRKS